MSEHRPERKHDVAPMLESARAQGSTPEPAGPSAMPAAMAKEMGHGGKDLPAMVRDMRMRFWICLIFTVPIFS